jgi:hypothetical protein
MNTKISYVIAACAGLYLFGCQAALAQPMRCSGERSTCLANCKKNPNPAIASRCAQTCHTSQSICMRTGCWDNGTFKYCGLMKQ